MMDKHIGEKHGRLTIIDRVASQKRPKYLCKCECGKLTEAEYGDLTKKYGATKSCGCFRRDRMKKYEYRNVRLYRIYSNMKARVHNPNNTEYKNYGKRGITICDEWAQSFETFQNWALSNGYRDDLSIDRIDVNGNYEPSNCRWATPKEQSNNTTRTIYLEYKGVTKPLDVWSKELGIKRLTLYSRIKDYGWSVEKALETPVKQFVKGEG